MNEMSGMNRGEGEGDGEDEGGRAGRDEEEKENEWRNAEFELYCSAFQLTLQEIDDLVDEWQPTPLVDDPTEFDEGTLDSVPTIQGPNGLKVKIQPNGKTVSPA